MTAEGGAGGLDPGERALVALSAALAAGGEDRIRPAMEDAREGIPPRRVEEAILQSYLFLGYPAALDGFALWRSVSGREAPPAAPAEWESWTRRGERVCRTVYGNQYGALRENVRRLHPDMERWIVTEGYGKVLGRPGLDLRVRELCIVSILSVLGAPVQLYSHLRGALNAGARPPEVDEALRVASGYSSEEDRRTAASTWKRVRERGT